MNRRQSLNSTLSLQLAFYNADFKSLNVRVMLTIFNPLGDRG